MRVIDPSYLPRRSKKVFMNKCVVIGKKYSESRMGVIPTDNPLVRIFLILDLINVFPGVLSECDVGPSLFRVCACDAGLNLNSSGTILPDEHTTNLSTRRGSCMLTYLARNFAIHHQ